MRFINNVPKFFTASFKWHCSKTIHISASECWNKNYYNSTHIIPVLLLVACDYLLSVLCTTSCTALTNLAWTLRTPPPPNTLTLAQGSRFSLKEPLNRKGSWGITARADLVMDTHTPQIICYTPYPTLPYPTLYLSLSSGTAAMSMPSMYILPRESSTIRKRALKRLDFPAPVLPTTPIWPDREDQIIKSCLL